MWIYTKRKIDYETGNIKYINSILDFPDDVDWVITLIDNVKYVLTQWTDIVLEKQWANITAFTDLWGWEVRITSPSHWLSTWRDIEIQDTTNYNWVYEVIYIDDDNYKITATYVATETWITKLPLRIFCWNYDTNIYAYNFSDWLIYNWLKSIFFWNWWSSARLLLGNISFSAPNGKIFNMQSWTVWDTIDFLWEIFIYSTKSVWYLWDVNFLNLTCKFVMVFCEEGFELKNNLSCQIKDVEFTPIGATSSSSAIIANSWANVGELRVDSIWSNPLSWQSFFDIAIWAISSILVAHPLHSTTSWWDFWKSWWVNYTTPWVTVYWANGTSDSSIIGSLYMEDNITVTNIGVIWDTWDITAFTDAGGGQVTVTSASHWLSNWVTVWIIDDDYTGKYTISNVTTDTFEITSWFFWTTTAIWETWWTKIEWTTYEMENERCSMTDNNELTFENLQGKKVIVSLWTNPKNESSPSVKEWEFCIIKNDKRLKWTKKSRQMTDKAGEWAITCTTTCVNGDIFEVYTRNLLDTTGMIMVNMSLIIK